MRTQDVQGHRVHWQAVIWGQFYLFATDVNGETYMLKVNEDGSLDIL